MPKFKKVDVPDEAYSATPADPIVSEVSATPQTEGVPMPDPTAKPEFPCPYCGQKEAHRAGCPVKLGTTAKCLKALCPACTFKHVCTAKPKD